METFNPLGSPLVNPEVQPDQTAQRSVDADTEFRRGEDSARKVVEVPKEDLDAKRRTS